MSAPVEFKSRLGLIAATVGSAVGLGNIWRFPAEAQSGGGASFLLIYIGCVLVLGIPVALAEMALGRQAKTDSVGAFVDGAGRRRPAWGAMGALGVLTAFLVSVFYLVVTGWTFEYMVESVTGGLYDGSGTFTDKMHQYVQGSTGPLVYTLLMVVLNFSVLLAGVTKGIERLSAWLMPLLFVLLLVFCVVSLSLPGAWDGVVFFLSPDFSRVTATTVVSALGQAFFSLSLGFGILVTYAGYFPARTSLLRTATTVSLLDLLVAVLMGIIVFPAVAAFSLQDHSLAGTALVFVTLPEVFASLPATAVWSALFFLLLSIAALTSTISLTEVVIKCLIDRLHMSRRRACLLAGGLLLPLCAVCSMSMGPLSGYKVAGLNMFDLLDQVTANFMLPISALGLCIYVGWVMPRTTFMNQLTNHGTLKGRPLFRAVAMTVRWVAPPLILLIWINTLL